jgi:hypothetical protein
MDVNAPVTLIGAAYREPESAVHDVAAVWASRHDGDFHHVSAAVLSGGAALVLAAGACAVVVVVVNRSGRTMTRLLRHADGRAFVDMPWGDLEEELSVDVAHPTLVSPAVAA